MELIFEDIFYFVLKNKSNKSFVGMTPLQIAYQLKLGLDEQSLWYKAVGNHIVGIVLASIDRERKIVFVKENLSMSLSNLREFASRARQEFAGYTFQFYKCGKFYSHSSSKLLNKIGA